MKRLSTYLVLLGTIVWLIIPMRLMGGQIMTPEIREWAHKVISQEEALGTTEGKRTIAVFPFVQNSGNTSYSPLQTGMAVMLATDLAKIKDLHVIDRIRTKAIIQELAISESGLTQQETAPRAGRLLIAKWILGGAFDLPVKDVLKIEARVLDVPKTHMIGNPVAEGALKEIFNLEKTLVKAIIKLLGISLDPEEEEAISKHLTTKLEALLALSRGLEASDKGEYDRGASEFRMALREDPKLNMAKDALAELESLGLVSPVSPVSSTDLLDDLRNDTSLTNSLTSKIATERIRSPSSTGFINLPPGYVGPYKR